MKSQGSAQTIFSDALEVTDSAARACYIEVACAGDDALHARVEKLLQAYAEAGGFLSQPSKATARFEAMLPNSLPLTEKGGAIIGRYKLLEKIGEGGCGVVYIAEQREGVRRNVALKIIKLGMDTRQVVARFNAERQALAMMDHPHIAKVFDAGATETGRPYFAMELVQGVPITAYCDQNRVSMAQRLTLFIQVCQAIQHAHQKGIIHRDIKPSNVMVSLHDGVPVPKVIDFGIAKATDQPLTEQTLFTRYATLIGTPAYMSPEQAELSGLDIDTRSDIYSLGVLLYELLTGRTPFDPRELIACGLDAMRTTIREHEPPRPSTKLATLQGEELTRTAQRRSIDAPRLLSLLRGDLDWIVIKCLEKDRSRRYETANGLAADLKRHLNHEPVVARPPTAAYRFEKALRRHKLTFAACAAVMLTLFLGLGISLWQYAGKTRAEREQHRLRQQAEKNAVVARAAQAVAAKQRDLARERLYESLVSEAGSIRRARQVGFRRVVLNRLQQALALGTTNARDTLLRREASACLGDWVGLDPVDISATESPYAAAVSADGAIAAVGLGSNHVSIVRTQTGRELALLEATGFAGRSLSFNQKGSALYFTTEDYGSCRERPSPLNVEKWSIGGDGSWTRDWIRPSTGLTWLASTEAGEVALTLAPSGSYWAILDLDRGGELSRVPVRNPLPTLPLPSITWDGKQFAFFSLEKADAFDAQVEVWDLETKRERTALKDRSGTGCNLSFSRDGTSLAVTYDSTMILYNTAGFSSILRVDGDFHGTFGAVIGSAAGLLAVPVSQELAVRLINLRSSAEVARIDLPTTPTAAVFSDNGSALVVTHQNGSRAAHLKIDCEKVRFSGHRGGVPVVEFSPDGTQLASAGKDRTLRLWDLSSPGHCRLLGHLPAPGQTLAYTPNGEFLVVGYYNSPELSIWSPRTGMQVRTVEASPALKGTSTFSCAISATSKYVAAIGSGLRMWHLEALLHPPSANATAEAPLIAEESGLSCVCFDRSGKRLAYMHQVNNNPPVVWLFVMDLAGHRGPSLVATNVQLNYVQGHCFLPKSGALAYVTKQRSIVFLDPSDGRVLREFSTREPNDTSPSFLANICVSPDESKLAVVSTSGTGVDMTDLATGKLLYSLGEEPGPVWWLAWSPDNRRLAVARANGEIAVWNLQEVEAQLAELESGH